MRISRTNHRLESWCICSLAISMTSVSQAAPPTTEQTVKQTAPHNTQWITAGAGVCDIAGASNCVAPDFSSLATWQMSARSVELTSGAMSADDFIARDTTINSVCAWGVYLPELPVQQNGLVCADRSDDFQIAIYEDSVGRPGVLLERASIDSSQVLRAPVSTPNLTVEFPGVQLYEYKINLSFPITGLTVGNRYWIEITNSVFKAEFCTWHWYNSGAGNHYSANGAWNGYQSGGEQAGIFGDHAWCVDQDIFIPPAVEGDCCDCSGNCQTTTLENCPDQWNHPTPTLLSNDACENAIDLGDALNLGGIPTDTTCATTDPNMPTHGTVQFSNDIWYQFRPAFDFNLLVNMCQSGNRDTTYNSAIAVYRNPDDPTTCACPPQGELFFGLTENDLNEGCNSLNDAGGGSLKPPHVLQAGDCVLIRVGGANGDRGRGVLSANVIDTCGCPSSPPMVLETIPTPSGLTSISKLRTLPISAIQDNPTSIGIRVSFVDLPPPFDVGNGLQLWVGEPFEVCANSGQGPGVLPGNCAPTQGSDPNQPGPTYFAAPLVCERVSIDTSLYDVINVYGEWIVPGGRYYVDTLDDSCVPFCPFSPVLEITTSIWGDVIGEPCTADGLCSPPDGSVGITTDVSAVLEMFKNSVFAPGKARADVEPGLIDFKINFTDVTTVLEAFSSKPYPFLPPITLPCSGAGSH